MDPNNWDDIQIAVFTTAVVVVGFMLLLLYLIKG